jgi:hypothetical protein
LTEAVLGDAVEAWLDRADAMPLPFDAPAAALADLPLAGTEAVFLGELAGRVPRVVDQVLRAVSDPTCVPGQPPDAEAKPVSVVPRSTG